MPRCSISKPLNRPKDENFYLSDGRVTLMIIPWRIGDYYAQDPARTGLDHIGFKVESVEPVKKDMEFLIGENPHMQGRPLGYGSEGEARLKLFQKCPLGCFHLTDIEGVHIDVAEEARHDFSTPPSPHPQPRLKITANPLTHPKMPTPCRR